MIQNNDPNWLRFCADDYSGQLEGEPHGAHVVSHQLQDVTPTVTAPCVLSADFMFNPLTPMLLRRQAS